MTKAARRMLIGLLLVPVLGYLAICGLMYWKQRDLVYYGEYTRVEAATTDFALARDDGVVLRGWVVNADASDVVLYFGGNGENVGGMRESLRLWLPRRASYLLAYRGYGASDGVPGQDLLFADALALYDDVVARHPGARVAVVGRSLGSGVAAHLAAHRPVERLVLVTPYDTLADVAGRHYPWLPTSLLVTERFDSVRWLRGFRGPVLVIRAGRDEIIPAANTDRLIAGLTPEPQVLALADAGHNDVLATRAEGDTLAAFLD
jgi:pimeloyl-ACP methyl ester carboxylesterase